MGDEALGIITACWYSAELDNPINKTLRRRRSASEYKYDPGFYAAATYVCGGVLEAGAEGDQAARSRTRRRS